MRVIKSSIAMLTAMLLTSTTLAATSNQTPASIMPMPKQPVIATKQVTANPSNAAKPAQVYADVPPGQPGATTQAVIPADVNTDVAYASMLPKGAEIVPGDPTKNEFFIVAAEDAAKIKQLLDRTKPGREIAVADMKSKQPILKVKLDESNATLVSIDVVSSVKTVAKQAMKPSVQMTETDEVMSIYTKNHITPVGSRVAAVVVPKSKPVREEGEEKPMLKLLASHGNSAPVEPATQTTLNPLLATAAVKPGTKVVMPDAVAVKQTIEQPVAKPVELPLASKETAPTLEMVLQQATSNKVKNETATVSTTAMHVADDKVKKKAIVASIEKIKSGNANFVAAKSSVIKTAAAKTAGSKLATTTTKSAVTPVGHPPVMATKSVAKKPMSTKKLVAGKVISYEQVIPEKKKTVAWSARHVAETAKSKKMATKKVAIQKRAINVGVVRSYSDYLTQTGHRAHQATE